MIRINRHSILMEPREERVFRKISIAQKARFPYASLFPTFAQIDEKWSRYILRIRIRYFLSFSSSETDVDFQYIPFHILALAPLYFF